MNSGSKLTKLVGAALLSSLAACSHGPEIRDANTAREQWSSLGGPGQRRIASNFYNLGRADVVKGGYWSTWGAGRPPGPLVSQRSPTPAGDGLQRGYVNLPVEGYTD